VWLEAVERAVEALPELEIVEHGERLERFVLGGGLERLEVRLADQAGPVAALDKEVADRPFAFRQLGAERPSAVLARVLAGDDRGARRCAGRVRTERVREDRAFGGELVEVWRLDLGIRDAERVPVLLVARDQEDIGSGFAHCLPH